LDLRGPTSKGRGRKGRVKVKGKGRGKNSGGKGRGGGREREVVMDLAGCHHSCRPVSGAIINFTH